MKFFLVLIFLIATINLRGQDSIVLMSGKVMAVKNVSLNTNTIAYRTLDKNKLKTIDPERVFSIRYADGNERIIFLRDTTDTAEYSVSEMRMFIKGELDADKYYKTNWDRGNNVQAYCEAFGPGLVLGAGASFFAIYGLVIPPRYSTVLGKFTPKMDKLQVSDPNMRNDPAFVEGYLRKTKSKKVRHAAIGGFAGFAAGTLLLILYGNASGN